MVSKGILIGAGVSGIIVLVVGIYFYQQIQQREALQNVQISLGGIDLKSLGLTSATLRLTLNMYNPNNSVTATLDRTEYQLFANGNELANGEIPNRYDIPPTGTITVPTDVTVSYLDSLRAVFSAFNNGEINWEMKGIAYFEIPIIGAIQIPYDFTKTTQFSGNSYQGSNSYQGNPSNSYPQNQVNNNAPVFGPPLNIYILGLHDPTHGYAYEQQPTPIRIPIGTTVALHFINEDKDTYSQMDLNIDAFNVHTNNLSYFQAQTITFIADKSGTYNYYSNLHPEMKGTITVDP